MKITKWSPEAEQDCAAALKDLEPLMDLEGKPLTTLNEVKFVKGTHGPVSLGEGGYGKVFKGYVNGKLAALKVYISFLCLSCPNYYTTVVKICHLIS